MGAFFWQEKVEYINPGNRSDGRSTMATLCKCEMTGMGQRVAEGEEGET